MKVFSQYSIISDKYMLEDSPTQNPSRFLPKRKAKTHSVIQALYFVHLWAYAKCVYRKTYFDLNKRVFLLIDIIYEGLFSRRSRLCE